MNKWSIAAAGMAVVLVTGVGCATKECNTIETNVVSCCRSQSDEASFYRFIGAGTAERLAECFFEARPIRGEEGSERRRFVHYTETLSWRAVMQVGEQLKRKDITDRAIDRVNKLLTPTDRDHINLKEHVDWRVFGVVPLEAWRITGRQDLFDLGMRYADGQWSKLTSEGFPEEARFWIDDMYMINTLQQQAYHATKDKKYLDRTAELSVTYLERLQQPNGLFFHQKDAPFYWARGNGWFAMGMAELLRDLPQDHPTRAKILSCYIKMMESLLSYQCESGLWRQLIDKPDCWEETSGTAMFATAMLIGIKLDILPEGKYGPVIRRAWSALLNQLDEKARLKEVCIGTSISSDIKFYYDRPRAVGDLHGQLPMFWFAQEMMNYGRD